MTNKVRSLVVEGRVDARSLATIANSLTSRNIIIKSRSHLVSMIIESYADMLISSNQGSTVASTELALEVLSNIGIEFKSSIQRNLTKLSKQIGAERALESLTDNISRIQSNPTSVVPSDLLDQAADLMIVDEDNEEETS